MNDNIQFSNDILEICSKVMKINLKTNEFYIYKIADEEQIKNKNFSDWIDIFAEEGNVHEDDKEKYYKHYCNDRLIEHFSLSPRTEFCDYKRRVRDNTWTTIRSIIRKSVTWTKENPVVYLYLINIGENHELIQK